MGIAFGHHELAKEFIGWYSPDASKSVEIVVHFCIPANSFRPPKDQGKTLKSWVSLEQFNDIQKRGIHLAERKKHPSQALFASAIPQSPSSLPDSSNVRELSKPRSIAKEVAI